MRLPRRLCLCVFIVLLLLFSGCGRDGPLLLDTDIDDIATVLEQSTPGWMNENKVTGMAVMVIRGARPVLTPYYGYQNRGTGYPITEQTVYRAVSLAKAIGAIIHRTIGFKGTLCRTAQVIVRF